MVAIALKYAVVPALSTCAGVTVATPEVDLTSFCSVWRRGSFAPPCAGEPNLTAISSGPLTPCPKFLEIRS